MVTEIGAFMYAMIWYDFGVMFDFCFAKIFSTAIFETYFCHKDIWISATESGNTLTSDIGVQISADLKWESW